jgi:GNAT superfamily N-acetyltransferase
VDRALEAAEHAAARTQWSGLTAYGRSARPGWTQVLARDDDGPVATGGLHVAGRTGWTGAATTVPRARGRGAQAALLALRLRLAAEQGADRVSVKAARGSAPLRLERAGFRVSTEVVPWSGAVRC